MVVPLLLIISLLASSSSRRPMDIYWNISNPLFWPGDSSSTREYVISVNEETGPWDYDQVRKKILIL